MVCLNFLLGSEEANLYVTEELQTGVSLYLIQVTSLSLYSDG